jgi:glutathione S-transferase
MLALYHSPFTRSHLIRFALEELELPYELRRLDLARGEHKQAGYLALNPLGQLPTLVDGQLILREAAAIALHLGDKAPERGLAPGHGSAERGPYYQWVVFAIAGELAALGKIVLHTRVLPEVARLQAVADQGQAEWKEVAYALTMALEGKPFLLGRAFSLADVMVGGALWLAQFLGVLSPYPELCRYFERVSSRPAFRRAYADAVAT